MKNAAITTRIVSIPMSDMMHARLRNDVGLIGMEGTGEEMGAKKIPS